MAFNIFITFISYVILCDSFYFNYGGYVSKNSIVNRQQNSITLIRRYSAEDGELFREEEEMKDIAARFLLAKYKGCDEDGCRIECTRDEARDVLKSVLPPVTNDELEEELNITMKELGVGDVVDETAFIQGILSNTYWRDAGELVVKELIFLDSLHANYYDGFPLLNDDDYDELKENLTWEGSAVATMTGKEARFVSAVASYRRGQPSIPDEEYQQLKIELKNKQSWVTEREPDALEKLGINTFMGYLHRQMNLDR